MELKKASLCVLFAVLLLLASRETVPGTEAKLCRYPSSTFWGPCVSDAHCAEKCIKEGFGGGDCHGVRRRCMCQKLC
ncbi:Defensin [Rhynchospora pubera]|uniref:Defensin n=1 Tax=Rhynchospora pubera TaxID=906938 RepID=A0AAV8CH63_9POAL|nr:Defensin [Rhynchospora pubera]KAJ4792140.1 Defensin [Rhynchospora pubera]